MIASEAFVYYAPGDVRRGTLSLECGPEEMLVKVILCARCGTDRTIFQKGHPAVDAHAPIVLGHEMVGSITEVGSKVKGLTGGLGYREGQRNPPEYLDFRSGERVIVQSRAARYRDGVMLMTDPVDILSFYINGAYSQYVRLTPSLIRTGSVIRVADNVTDEEAVLAEPAACALESIFATPHAVGADPEGRHICRSGILKGGRCCVIGTGAISLIYARLARLEGASQVVVLARSEEKAGLVRGILKDEAETIVIPSEKTVLKERLLEITRGRLFDDVVAACSDPEAQRLMLELYSPEGYAVGACFGGTRARVDNVNMDLHHYRIAKTVGTSGCSTRTLCTVVRRLTEGRLSLKGFLDPRPFGLDDDPSDFFLSNGNGLRPVLDPWKIGRRP